MLEIDHRNRNAVVRISIFDHEFWSRGCRNKAMSLLLKYGLEILNLHRVGLGVFSFNKRVIKSYEKLGFKQEGTIRDRLFYNGGYHDSIIMGVMKDDFNRILYVLRATLYMYGR